MPHRLPHQHPHSGHDQLFLNSQLDAAGQMLFENNPLSVVCSLVCDHKKQCEGHCVLGRKSAPVHISSIENYISDSYLDRMKIQREANKGKRAAIIGSGQGKLLVSAATSSTRPENARPLNARRTASPGRTAWMDRSMMVFASLRKLLFITHSSLFDRINAHRLWCCRKNLNPAKQKALQNCFCKAFCWWERVDSNHRSKNATDLQSAPIGRSGTLPHISCSVAPHC